MAGGFKRSMHDSTHSRNDHQAYYLRVIVRVNGASDSQTAISLVSNHLYHVMMVGEQKNTNYIFFKRTLVRSERRYCSY